MSKRFAHWYAALTNSLSLTEMLCDLGFVGFEVITFSLDDRSAGAVRLPSYSLGVGASLLVIPSDTVRVMTNKHLVITIKLRA
jgi:hypothetical protein